MLLPRSHGWHKAANQSGRRRPMLCGIRWTVSLLALLCAILMAPSALAQQWLVDGNVGLSTGLEGADLGSSVDWQRARTRLIAGVDLTHDEHLGEAWGVRGFVELERGAGVGGEFRYQRWFSPEIGAYLGATALLAPETLFGGQVGGVYLLPLGERLSLYVEGAFHAFPLGSDRPAGGTVMWALLGVGARVRF